MSDLLSNLSQIYTTKLQIKQAIGTSSDVFAEYPGYISSMVLPDGTAYITANGVSDISSYQYVDVDVPSGGITPSGTYNIINNGTYDVTTYASAYVNVSGGSSFTHIDDFSSATLTANSNYQFESYNKGGSKIRESFIEYDVTDATAQGILENYINPDSPNVDNILYNFAPGNGNYDIRCWCIYDNGSTATAGVNDYYGNIMSVSAKFLYEWDEDYEHIYLFIIEDRSKLYEVPEGGTTSLTINHNGTDIYVGDCKTVDVNVAPTYNIIDSLDGSDSGWYFQIKELDGYSVPTGNVKYLFIKYNSSGETISYNYNVDEILTATGFSAGSSLGLNIFYNGQGGITFGFENYVGSDSSDYINPLAFTQGESDVLRPTGGFYYGLGGNFDVSDPQIFIWNTKVSIY